MLNNTLNLDPPPGFRGLDPKMPIRRYERHLPHWRQMGVYYAVTFRLSDSLPKAKLEMLRSMRREWESKFPEPRSEHDWEKYAQSVTNRVNAWLDQGAGECHLRNPIYANALAEAILQFQGERHHTACYVIMPNHCHLVMRPFDTHELEEVIGCIKGATSRYINQSLGRTGDLWQQESFDRIIRDELHLFRAIQYVGNNPLMASLPKEQWHRWIDPKWEELHWGFRTH